MPFKDTISLILGDVRFLFFIVALCLYTFWGSPTPDNPGLIEVIIGTLLILSVGFQNIIHSIIDSLSAKNRRWVLSISGLFLYGLTAPLVLGVVRDAPIAVIIRDMIGFVFLCLPLFIVPFIQKKEFYSRSFLLLVLIIGFGFSLRVVIPENLMGNSSAELLYLANSPLVLFTALFLLSLAFYKLFEKVTFNNIKISILCFFLVSVPLFAMLADLQRASVLSVVLILLFLFGLGIGKAPLKMLLPFFVFAIMVICIQPYALGVIDHVSEKTSQVGLNMRLQELQAIWSGLSGSWLTVFFGQGWGSSFASPAVGELEVSFTHSLLSYVLFKMGVFGLLLTLIYLFFIFEKLLHLYFSDPVKGNTLMWPLLIPIFLYASHKSFDFGLLLSLILVSAEARQSDKKAIV